MSLTASPRPSLTEGEAMLLEQERIHERIVAGDKLALLESLDRIGGMVFCVALLLTGQHHAAEALTEALFLELWREPDQFAPKHGPLGVQMIRRLVDGIVPRTDAPGARVSADRPEAVPA